MGVLVIFELGGAERAMTQPINQASMPSVTRHPEQTHEFSKIDPAIEAIAALTRDGRELSDSKREAVVSEVQKLSYAQRHGVVKRASDKRRGEPIDLLARLKVGLNPNSAQFEAVQAMLTTGYDRRDPKEFLKILQGRSRINDHEPAREEFASVLAKVQRADAAAHGVLDLLRPRPYGPKGNPLADGERMVPVAFATNATLRVAVRNELDESANLLRTELAAVKELNAEQRVLLASSVELLAETATLLDWRASAGARTVSDAGVESAARLSAKLERLAHQFGEIPAP